MPMCNPAISTYSPLVKVKNLAQKALLLSAFVVIVVARVVSLAIAALLRTIFGATLLGSHFGPIILLNQGFQFAPV